MREFRGIAASDGIALGPAFVYSFQEKQQYRRVCAAEETANELARMERALSVAHEQLQRIYEKASAEAGEGTAAIFLAHQEFLEDPSLLEEAQKLIRETCATAEAAVTEGFEYYAGQLEAMEDDYLRERAGDLRDVSRRVLQILTGTQDVDSLANLTQPVIVVARDLTPSDTAQMDKKMVRGFCTAAGGFTSHTAIIARILGIPAVVGAGESLLEITAGTQLIVDGRGGQVIAAPDETTAERFASLRRSHDEEQNRLKALATRPGQTRDGRRVQVVANIADASSAEAALDLGAEGVGLYRTEYLYLNRQSVPTEAEQYRDYNAVTNVLGDRPLLIRTLDIGGDKQLPYVDFGHELNPFLGWRAIRLCLDSPQLFEPQLRAILRASAERNVQIMFPMIATLAEVRRAKEVLKKVQRQLADEHVAFDAGTPIGIMVEIPSAALAADLIAPEVDFFSIGTNDLIQYTLACDRGNEKVAHLYDPLHPAILRLIKGVIDAAHRAGKWVGMCGEMAGDPEAIPLLLGLGLDEFSMNAPAIPAAKELIRSLTFEQAQQISIEALAKPSAEEIRGYLRSLGLANQRT
jgi:phosphotransferase system enzyme I (PtsI)